MSENKGMIYLIGAGPGDYKLITVKGKECIEKADVIIYDYLADQKLLQWARPDAELIYAGKQCRYHTLKQHEINALLVEKGKEGKLVARLKGGDPLVFGRGGEEALALHEAGVPFEFVPGVTSGIAAPAYAGIPVTQRAMATSFAIITGHEDPTKAVSGINWEGLATSVDTLCFVMGIGHLPYITSQLMAHGRSGDTPAAVIRWGTKPTQEVLVTTVAEAADDVARAGLKPPAVFIVGDVVRLREELRWFDTKPLFGKKVVVTRARAQASQLVEKLEELGAEVIEAAAIKTVPLGLTEANRVLLHELTEYKALCFTSAQGVAYFFEALHEEGLDGRALGQAKVCAIGSATAKVLADKGILADIVPASYQGEAVADALLPLVSGGDKVLLLQPKKARAVIPDSLSKAGLTIDILRLYETVEDDQNRDYLAEVLAADDVDYITFTSSSTVTNTLHLLGENGCELVKKAKSIVCIGPITAATCMEAGITPDLVGDTFTIPAMVDLITTDAEKKRRS